MRHHLQGGELLPEIVNLLLKEGALTPDFRAHFGLASVERITVRFIRMSRELANGLDYPSKLSRLAPHIEKLIADGEAQARAFLYELDHPESAGHTGNNGTGNNGEVRPAELI